MNAHLFSKSIHLFRAHAVAPLALPMACQGISCGFPSPAADYMEQVLDLNQVLIKDKEATFLGRVQGDSMQDAQIFEGDVLVINRALEPKNNDIILGMLCGEFTVKRFEKSAGTIVLHPANPRYRPIVVAPDMDFSVWGVVTYVIHKTR